MDSPNAAESPSALKRIQREAQKPRCLTPFPSRTLRTCYLSLLFAVLKPLGISVVSQFPYANFLPPLLRPELAAPFLARLHIGTSPGHQAQVRQPRILLQRRYWSCAVVHVHACPDKKHLQPRLAHQLLRLRLYPPLLPYLDQGLIELSG